MITRKYGVSFVTPAFLGNAEQQAQWRTPPFKALLRQWWRIANANDVGFDHERLADKEGRLFGAASDEGGSHRSRIQIRLNQWAEGKLATWPDDPTIKHPEVTDRNTGKTRPVGAHLYLGYGPLNYLKRGTSLENKDGHAWTAITANNEHQILTVRFADQSLDAALKLAQWFGTLGGRSRNGWGSLHLEPRNDTPAFPELSARELTEVLRDWKDCLKLEWPHAIGRDDKGPLVWTGKLHKSWSDAMKELAQVKINFRTTFSFKKRNGLFDDRHFLAYPVTNHPVHGWGNAGRLANQMRFKVAREQDGQHRYKVFHLPAAFPTEVLRKENNIELSVDHARQVEVWTNVHDVLDQHGALERLK